MSLGSEFEFPILPSGSVTGPGEIGAAPGAVGALNVYRGGVEGETSAPRFRAGESWAIFTGGYERSHADADSAEDAGEDELPRGLDDGAGKGGNQEKRRPEPEDGVMALESFRNPAK